MRVVPKENAIIYVSSDTTRSDLELTQSISRIDHEKEDSYTPALPYGSLDIKIARFLDVCIIEFAECVLSTKCLGCANGGNDLFREISAVRDMVKS